MNPLYGVNGLVFFEQSEIRLREYLRDVVAAAVTGCLESVNRAWKIRQIEAPILTPTNLISDGYGPNEIYFVGNTNFILRSETTPGTYTYAEALFKHHMDKPPLCLWQYGKSFRREQTAPLSRMKLKEFYQQEFQCFYATNSKCDYQEKIVPMLAAAVEHIISKKICTVESDRLPSYSTRTVDFEVNGLEICSISLRHDFKDVNITVLEIAFGLDRVIYCARPKVNNA